MTFVILIICLTLTSGIITLYVLGLQLCQQIVDCSLWVKSELLPQAKEFKYFGILFTTVAVTGGLVQQTLHWTVVVFDLPSTRQQ